MTLALIVWMVMTVIPALNVMGIILFVCFGVTGGISAFVWAVTEGKYDGAIFYWLKQLKWSVPLVILAALIPNKETAWYIVGAYATEAVVTSETVGELGNASKDLMLDLVKKAREELGNISTEQLKAGAKAAVEGSKEVAK